MIVSILLFIIGLLCLIKGGDWFVDGATALARRFHLPELLIGATVVSIGTTLPEVMVSTMSALSGHGEIAYGNAIGSVICNAALIAAITIAVRPGQVDPKTLRTPVVFFFIAAGIYCVAAYGLSEFTRPVGIVMLVVFVIYMVMNVRQMTKNPLPVPEKPEKTDTAEEEEMGIGKTLLLLVVGAALIAVGADLLVDNGTLIAQELGVPESVIALTFVALGTSLPELVTAITSLIKGHGDLSLGNIIGANIFNLVLVSGMSVTLAPFTVPQSSTIMGMNSSLVLEIPLMIIIMLILTVPALKNGRQYRSQGIIMLLIYAAFCIIQFTM
ncbi:MAG TPA: sodium:proton exchanger [Lachnospiraceae bacterium]|nr:sodium:proton exchanger [Lachnospiraceae bacterium]